MLKHILPIVCVALTVAILGVTAFQLNTPIKANQQTTFDFVTSIADDGSNLLDNPRSVWISGNYAYVASRADTGLTIFDVTNPESPTIVGQLQDAVSLTNATFVQTSGNYAFVSSSNGLLTSVNIANPASPSIADTLTVTGLFDFSISGNYLYAATDSSTQCGAIIDISDPTNLQSVNTFSDATICNGNVSNIIQNTTLFTYSTTGTDEYLSAWDISSGNAATLLGSWRAEDNGFSNLNCQKLLIKNNHLYGGCWQTDQILAWNISDVSNIQVTDSITDSTNLDGAIYGAIYDDYLIINAFLGNKINVISIADPTNISIAITLSEAPYTSANYSAAMKDNYFITPSASQDRISVFKLTIPQPSPTPSPQSANYSSASNTGTQPSMPHAYAKEGKTIYRDNIFAITPGSAFSEDTDLHFQRYPKSNPLSLKVKDKRYYQLSDIVDIWFISYTNKTRLFDHANWIVGFNYNENELTNDSRHYFPESSLSLATSYDNGTTWQLLLNNVKNPNQNSIAVVTKSGGKYMLVGNGNQSIIKK